MSKEVEDKTTKTSAPKKKGTVHSEMVLGAAALMIKKSVDSLHAAVDTVSKLSEQAENYQGLIAQKEDRVKELDVEFAEKKRQKDVELQISVRADEDKMVTDILVKHNKVAVDATELTELKASVEKNEKEISDDKAKAIAMATSAMSKDHKNEIALKDSEFKATQAQSVARIESLTSEVTFLRGEVASWKGALDAERSASVERSKANAIGSLNVGTPGKN